MKNETIFTDDYDMSKGLKSLEWGEREEIDVDDAREWMVVSKLKSKLNIENITIEPRWSREIKAKPLKYDCYSCTYYKIDILRRDQVILTVYEWDAEIGSDNFCCGGLSFSEGEAIGVLKAILSASLIASTKNSIANDHEIVMDGISDFIDDLKRLKMNPFKRDLSHISTCINNLQDPNTEATND